MTRPGRVLVVDDEPMIGEVLRLYLQSEHVVVVVGSAGEAIERVRSGDRFDAVLCDVSMPRMSGPDLYDALKAIAPELCEAMVFMSGGVTDARLRARLEATGRPCVGKPFDIAVLRALLRDRVVRTG